MGTGECLTELLIPLQTSHPVSGGRVWDYPYLEAKPLVQEILARLGAKKLLWGSDMPCSERLCTYKQTLSYFKHYGSILTLKKNAWCLAKMQDGYSIYPDRPVFSLTILKKEGNAMKR
jgi:hypothetical protein